ncbi:MAG: RIP metalloprotease RseP [Rhodocyclaceae bacterium]|nr:RIP metalloprotease RseP [Rhodocyclaceae bacterium]
MLNAPLTYLLAFVVALGLLVVVHEFGHYIVARICGVKVLRFAVGFGKVLWSRRYGADQTEWAICSIPLGGYVKMLDEREGAVSPADLPRAFTQQSLGKRSLIVLAGPVANLILAILLYWGLFMHGVEELRPILGTPAADSAAARANVERGDLVTAVNGREIASWEELRWEILRDIADGRETQLQIRGLDGADALLLLATHELDIDSLDRDPIHLLGLSIEPPRLPAIVGRVMPDTPAERAGLRVGDLVSAIDGRPIALWSEVAQIARQSPGKTLQLSIKRDDALFDIALVPALVEENGRSFGRIGFSPQDDPALREAMFSTVSYAPGIAIAKAVTQTWETSVFTLRMIGRMLMGDLSLKNLSGPVTIADYAGQSIQLGIAYYIKFLALISISIGVLNLLPIPVLDGGHLMYYLAEFMRGKPLPESVFAFGQRIGLALLLLMMSVALFNDLNRQFFG